MFPMIFAIFRDIGHSEGFYKNCSPRSVSLWAQRPPFTEIDPISSCDHGEQFIKTCRLCPTRLHCIRFHGEHFRKICSCTQSPDFHGEQFRKISSCAQTSMPGGRLHHKRSHAPEVSQQEAPAEPLHLRQNAGGASAPPAFCHSSLFCFQQFIQLSHSSISYLDQ